MLTIPSSNLKAPTTTPCGNPKLSRDLGQVPKLTGFRSGRGAPVGSVDARWEINYTSALYVLADNLRHARLK